MKSFCSSGLENPARIFSKPANVQPGGLVHRARAVGLGLDVQGADDVQAVRVKAVILGEIVALERRVVAEQEPRFRMVAEPGVMVRQIP